MKRVGYTVTFAPKLSRVGGVVLLCSRARAMCVFIHFRLPGGVVEG